MKCSLCGLEFSEKEMLKACSGCIVTKSCNLLKCPNCGYESPKESTLIKKIKEYRKRVR